ncbi:MAG: sigma-70 family RNA polymerase sigma factor [Planctomycetes bacterium]|nr:sigma-70 family RNA polymerase sigma factor [Planctomycetota bacterium]
MGSVCEEELVVIDPARRGSKEAFESIVKIYMKNAYFIALGLVGNRDDALELSQEAFILAYRNIKRLKPNRKFFPWFYQILRNVCFSHLRKRRHRQTRSLEEIEEQTPIADVDDSFTPDVVAERNETKDMIWKAIGKLDDKHREVIILRHFQNLSYEQIAQNLFCSRGTVMSRLYHARKKLKELLRTKKGGETNGM